MLGKCSFSLLIALKRNVLQFYWSCRSLCNFRTTSFTLCSQRSSVDHRWQTQELTDLKYKMQNLNCSFCHPKNFVFNVALLSLFLLYLSLHFEFFGYRNSFYRARNFRCKYFSFITEHDLYSFEKVCVLRTHELLVFASHVFESIFYLKMICLLVVFILVDNSC